MPVEVRGRYSQNSSLLTINRLQMSDSGRFLCRLLDGNQVELSRRETTLLVLGPPIIKRSPTQPSYLITAADASQTVVLQVHIESVSPVSVVWKRDGEVVMDTVHAKHLSNHSLALCAIREADYGNYTVIVTNDFGSAFLDTFKRRLAKSSSVNNNRAITGLAVACALLSMGLVAGGIAFKYGKCYRPTSHGVSSGLRRLARRRQDHARICTLSSTASIQHRRGDGVIWYPPGQ
ncbi:hemicentin-1-like [Sycon ciliatum]|uniref:hemicentin-1-like n=1 Tax=Sycon ciliatum TaxID=27933 RepID=UPI0031F6E889